MESLRAYAQLMERIGYLEGLVFAISDDDIYVPVQDTLAEIRKIIDQMILGDGKDSSLRSE